MTTKSILIRAAALKADLVQIPERPGIYLFYLAGGIRMLEQTRYFDTDDRVPSEHEGRTHLYTGAARNLRLRMKHHLARDYRSSTFRKSLLAVEFTRKAISKSGTRHSNVTDEKSLTKWLCANMTVEIKFTKVPFEAEHDLIHHRVSPLNITWRREHEYSRLLMAWRSAAFPRRRP